MLSFAPDKIRSVPIPRPCDLRFLEWGLSLVKLYRDEFVARVHEAVQCDPQAVLAPPRPTRIQRIESMFERQCRDCKSTSMTITLPWTLRPLLVSGL
jgi:hypothetical protein